MWTCACIRTRLGPLAHSMQAPEPLKWSQHSLAIPLRAAMSPEFHYPLLKPHSSGPVCSLPAHGSNSQRWEGKIHLTRRRQVFPASVYFFLADKLIEETKSFSCLCVSMCAWLRVQTHRLTVKECCFHYHLLLYDHDREHTARIHLCEDY